jgi:hypothetical protein
MNTHFILSIGIILLTFLLCFFYRKENKNQ